MRVRTKPWRCGYTCNCLIDPTALPDLATVSYGGGVQSTSLLVLAARGAINFRTFLFCNVGDDSEHPGTLQYVDHIAKPYADVHGIDLQELQRTRRDGTPETLWSRLVDPRTCTTCKGHGWTPGDDARVPCPSCAGTGKVESRSLPIPVRMSNGAPGNRSCTADFKIRVVSRWLKQHGATADHPATVGIGISLDEIQRANTRVKDDWERVTYPLVGIGIDTGLSMRRDDCMRVIREEPLPRDVAAHARAAVAAGDLTDATTVRQLVASDYTMMPVPPKSSCFFCPFHRPTAWQDLARETPELFEKACGLEDTLNARRRMLGKDEVFLTRFAVPLRDAINTTDETLFDDVDDADGTCSSGYCWT